MSSEDAAQAHSSDDPVESLLRLLHLKDHDRLGHETCPCRARREVPNSNAGPTIDTTTSGQLPIGPQRPTTLQRPRTPALPMPTGSPTDDGKYESARSATITQVGINASEGGTTQLAKLARLDRA